MRIKLTESKLRKIIRSFLREQVVGYQAPAKAYDDPEAPAGDEGLSGKSGDESDGSSDGGGYLSVGDMGVDTSLHGSTDEDQASAMQVKQLTQQRQQALDAGDTEKAENLGQQLSLAKKIRS